jgi:hypothetical protein
VPVAIILFSQSVGQVVQEYVEPTANWAGNYHGDRADGTANQIEWDEQIQKRVGKEI